MFWGSRGALMLGKNSTKSVMVTPKSCFSYKVSLVIVLYQPNTNDGRRVQFFLDANSELHCRGRCRFNSCPRPIRITWQMQMMCLAVSMLVAEIHSCRSNCGNGGVRVTYRCRRRFNLRKIRIATISVRMVVEAILLGLQSGQKKEHKD